MHVRTLPVLLGLAAAALAPALAQTYPSMHPIVRTTDAPALRAIASRREIHERFALGLDAESKRAWTAAVPEFERILAMHPAEPLGSTAQYDLAIAYANLQRYDDAARALHAAIALDPGFLAAMANLISVDIARGDLRDARNVADRFVGIAPESARALYSRGIVALRSGDAKTARADFGKLLQSDPSYAVAHYDLGLAEEQLGNYAGASAEFSTALALAPRYARARFALGAIFLRLGEKSQARAAFAQVVNDPNGDPSLRTLAVAMRDSIASP